MPETVQITGASNASNATKVPAEGQIHLIVWCNWNCGVQSQHGLCIMMGHLGMDDGEVCVIKKYSYHDIRKTFFGSRWESLCISPAAS